MLKSLVSLLLISVAAFASSGGGEAHANPDLTMTWVGISCLLIFIIGYYFVAAEEKYEIDKAKPALLIGTLMFILVSLYYSMNGLNMDRVIFYKYLE